MIPRFAFARPASLEEAWSAWDAAAADAAWIAGGTELLQVMKMGFAQFGMLIDLKAIPDLHGIDETDGALRIGAAVTHREIERSPLVARAFPALTGLERQVANVRVRSTGTLGGNLAFAEPHSDPATLLLACDARVELARRDGRREASIEDFVVGPLATTRDPDEVVVAVRIPAAGPGEGRAYRKIAFFERPAASVAVRLTVRDDAIEDATVAVGSLTEVPQAVPAAALALRGAPAGGDGLRAATRDAVAGLDEVEAIDDLNGSPEYKRYLGGVLLAQAVDAAVAEATTGA